MVSRTSLFCVFAAIVSAAAGLAASQSSSPALLVLNKEEATLAIVDPASGRVTARVPTGEGPHEVVVSEDGALAFASNYGAQTPGNSISMIDIKAAKELRRVDLGALRRPHGLGFAGGKLFFTAETNRVIGAYDPAANKIDWIFGTGQAGTHMIVVTADASKIFAANIGSDSITILERGATPPAWDATVIPVGKGPEAIDLSPSGRELWTAHSRDGAVSIIDVATRHVIATIDLGTKRSNRLKFTRDGKLVLITDLDGGELRVIDAAARREIKRLPLGHSPEGILIAPDGARAFVAITGDNEIAVVDLNSLAVVGRIAPGKGPDGMAWAER